MASRKNYRWFVVAVFFVFMMLHQADKLMIGPLTSDIMDTFKITKTQMGAVTTGALIVGAIFYPLWGYLYDRYARAKLLALASLLWGATTWLNGIAPSYPFFLVTRASTGIDDSSYPGLFSLLSDYFGPHVRGRVYGILQLSQPIGYLVGMMLALLLGGTIGWKGIFYITGSLGIVLAIVIFFGVKETSRGQSEPEMADLEQVSPQKFKWSLARDLFKKPSMILIFLQGFFGVFPWNVITYWFFVYLEEERGYESNSILITMIPAILILAVGYPIGGALGDYLFKKTKSGRAIVSTIGIMMGVVLLWITMEIPINNQTFFMIMLCLTAFFIPFAAANVVSTVFDITLPEIRSTASAIQNFFESAGAALAPLIAGIIADQSNLKTAILLICTITWLLCTVFFAVVIVVIPKDINLLREQMRQRAADELTKQLIKNG
jgi:MFS family permease